MPPKIRQVVDAGRVFCPVRRRDVDLETCTACSFARDFGTDADGLVVDVVCNPTLASLGAADR